jgi:hypothetical protein
MEEVMTKAELTEAIASDLFKRSANVTLDGCRKLAAIMVSKAEQVGPPRD